MRTLLCSSYRYGMTVTVILIIWDIHVSGADVIGIQHAEVGDPAHRQMLWPLRLTKYPRLTLSGNTATMTGCHLHRRRRPDKVQFPVIRQLWAYGRPWLPATFCRGTRSPGTSTTSSRTWRTRTSRATRSGPTAAT